MDDNERDWRIKATHWAAWGALLFSAADFMLLLSLVVGHL